MGPLRLAGLLCFLASTIALLSVTILLSACGTTVPPAIMPTRTASKAYLDIVVQPEGSAVFLDGERVGQTPAQIEMGGGIHQLRVERHDYRPLVQELHLAPGELRVIQGQLADTGAPTVSIRVDSRVHAVGDIVHLHVTATDNEGVVRMRILNGQELIAVHAGSSFQGTWTTDGVQPGRYVLVAEALDAAGNRGVAECVVELKLPSPTLTPTTASPTPTSLPTPTASISVVDLRAGEINLRAYQYERALYQSPDSPAFPYPLLHRDEVGAPELHSYGAVFLENEYLILTFLPELGGRLYQCTFKPTGQDLFYNNPVVKPSHWGPPEQGWWLALGGLEYCLPVDEHGYTTAMPWEFSTTRDADGSASITLRHTERTRNIQAQVTAELRPGSAAIELTTRLSNPDREPKSYQYWANAMLTLGVASMTPRTEFILPTEEVLVHSTGDDRLPGAGSLMTWPIYVGRDLSWYLNWSNWLGVFVPSPKRDYVGAYNHDTDLGIVRIFPRKVAPGVKLFAFGTEFEDRGHYSDDGSQYFEIWGGTSSSFWEYATLAGGTTLEWTEVWYPLWQTGGLSQANESIAINAWRLEGTLHLNLMSVREQTVRIVVSLNGEVLASEARTLAPDSPFTGAFPLTKALSGEDLVTLEVLDEWGRPIADCRF